MENDVEKEKMKRNIIIFIVSLLFFISSVIAILIYFNDTLKILDRFGVVSESRVITDASLIKTIDMSNLSSLEFDYKGIVKLKSKKEFLKGEVDYYAKYHAVVKYSIDLNDIKFSVNDKKKTVRPILPDIKCSPDMKDERYISYMPKDPGMDVDEVLEKCREDVINESKKSEEAYKMAKDNLKSTIEAVTLPVIGPKGYKIVW